VWAWPRHSQLTGFAHPDPQGIEAAPACARCTEVLHLSKKNFQSPLPPSSSFIIILPPTQPSAVLPSASLPVRAPLCAYKAAASTADAAAAAVVCGRKDGCEKGMTTEGKRRHGAVASSLREREARAAPY